MNVTPLLNAAPMVQIHVAFALTAICATVVLAIYKKGTPTHRWLGRTAAGAMGLTALSSSFILELNAGRFSYIHILSVVTLLGLANGVREARLGNRRGHVRSMVTIAVLGLGVAGAFTFVPGRLMWRVFMG